MTLAEIADSAGVSTQTIFAHFPSEEDILFCTM
jgi:AcrR family transcriptional regulator